MAEYKYLIDALNAIDVANGGTGGHAYMIDALNEWAVRLGGTGGHKYTIDALNEIASREGAATGFHFDIQELNAISTELGGTGGHTYYIDALNEIVDLSDGGGGGGDYVGPLDIVSGALCAYSTRALSAAARGQPLYTVREDGGNTTQAFSSDSDTGLPPTSAITAFLNGANGFTALWNDQSGGGSNLALAPGNDGSQLGLRVISASDYPAIGPSENRSSTPQMDSIPSGNDITFPGGDPLVVFVVAYYDASDTSAANPLSLTDESVGTQFQFYCGSGYGMTAYLSNVDYDAAEWDVSASVTGMHILELTVAADGAVHMLVDGVDSGATVSSGVQAALDNLTGYAVTAVPYHLGVNAPNFDTASANYEIIAWRGMSDANRLSVRQNMAEFYGITL